MPNNDPQDEVFYLTLLIYSYFSHTLGIGIYVVFTRLGLRVSLIYIVVGQGNPTRGPE